MPIVRSASTGSENRQGALSNDELTRVRYELEQEKGRLSNAERDKEDLKAKVMSLTTELERLRMATQPPIYTVTSGPIRNIRGTHDSAMPLKLDALKARVAASGSSSASIIGVLVIACRRDKYLDRALTSFTRNRPNVEQFPIVVSQDGSDASVRDILERSHWSTAVYHMRHEQGIGNGYNKLAQHYGWALRRMFDDLGFKQVIILEEDMEIAPDFFNYFWASLPLLQADPKLYCVSAWNDNGYESAVHDPEMVYRTDFFPGLGWMLTAGLWSEIRDRWPDGYWDEFMRRPDVRKGRHCLRPEISRSYTFGEEGESKGQYFTSHLSRIKLNKEPIDFSSNLQLLRHVASEEAFDNWIETKMSACREVSLTAVEGALANRPEGSCLRIKYLDSMYQVVANRFGLMPDEKEGIRRTAYKSVIFFTLRGHHIFMYDSWPSDL